MSAFGQGSINKIPCKVRDHCPHAESALDCSYGQHLISWRRQRPVLVSANLQKLVSSHSARQHHSKPLSIFCSQTSNAKRGSPSGPALRASVADTSIEKTEDLGLAVTPSDDSSTSAPILSGAGGGIFLWWQLGAVFCLAFLESLLCVCKFTAGGVSPHPFLQLHRIVDGLSLGNRLTCLALAPGAVKYLQQQHDLTQWQMRGASAGALVACLAACNVDPQEAYEAAHRCPLGSDCPRSSR